MVEKDYSLTETDRFRVPLPDDTCLAPALRQVTDDRQVLCLLSPPPPSYLALSLSHSLAPFPLSH